MIWLEAHLVNLAEHTWHSSVRGMDGRFPECSLFLETLPSLLNSVSAMVGMRGTRDKDGACSGWRCQFPVLTYIDR
jgi:hypothetical protein